MSLRAPFQLCFELPTLHGITVRDSAIAQHRQKPLGDLTSALDLKKSK